jgi:chromosomal replication initiation ATPase DnaA
MRTFKTMKEKYNDVLMVVSEDKKSYVHAKLIDLMETFIQQAMDEFKLQIEEDREVQKDDRDWLHTIREMVCKFHRIPSSDLLSRNRVAEINITRQICMWVSKNLQQYHSMTAIGSYYNRDHATVINGIKRVESMYQVDVEFREDLRKLLLHLSEKGVDTSYHFQILDKLKLLR